MAAVVAVVVVVVDSDMYFQYKVVFLLSSVIDFGLNRGNIGGMQCNGEEFKNNFVITYNI